VRDAGFTLVELLVALAVAALVMAALPLGLRRDGGAAAVQRTAADIGAALRRARAAAIAENRPAVFAIDLAEGRYTADRAPPAALPPGLEISVRAADMAIAGGRAGIGFYPDGSSTGGRIAIAGGAATAHVAVDWLTGHVAVGR